MKGLSGMTAWSDFFTYYRISVKNWEWCKLGKQKRDYSTELFWYSVEKVEYQNNFMDNQDFY